MTLPPRLLYLFAAAGLLAGCSRSESAPGEAAPASLPVVVVAPVTHRNLAQALTVQAEFRPYQEVELHAKVAGYLKSIPVDFGDQVKAGQLIATLEVPELGDDLARAEAAAKHAEADAEDVKLQTSRLQEVGKSNPHLLAQQDLDAAAAKQSMAEANLAAANAEASKYRTLFSYTKITAPFAGVITQRYADPGALIQAGTSSSQSGPIVRLSENDRLRVDFPVSVTYTDAIRVGDPVEITLEGSGRKLSAKITRFSHRIQSDTRTMETEVEIPNPDLAIIPGMYATVTLDTARREDALAIPIEAVGGGDRPTAMVVGADHRIAMRRLRLGLETPNAYEVLGGLQAGDQVVVGNRVGLEAGLEVKVAEREVQP